MERPEMIESRESKNADNHTAQCLYECVAFQANPSKIDINKESQKIADVFDLSKNNGMSESEKIDAGAKLLSSDLQTLWKQGKTGAYNELLSQAAGKIQREPEFNPMIMCRGRTGKDDFAAGTWANVAIRSGDGLDAYRIVQPGNTFNQIVAETYKQFKAAADGLDINQIAETDNFKPYQEYYNEVVKLNPQIKQTDKIFPGQAIRLRDSYFWN